MFNMVTIFILLLLFQIKHFVADYPLQTEYMLGKFKDRGWILPLLSHAGVHSFFTFMIASIFVTAWVALLLASFDLIVHFGMDRIKTSSRWLGKYKSLTATEYITANPTQKRHNRYFWWALGFDQAVHHLTHYAIIASIILLT